MVHMNEPFHSIAAAAMFGIFGLLFGAAAISEVPVIIADLSLNMTAAWMISGVSFVMSYFSLVHLKR